MNHITVNHNPDHSFLEDKGVFSWPVWTKEVSEFPWKYEDTETCYFLEGSVIVTPDNGEPVKIGKGDYVVFPQGMKCVWKIVEDVKKHYTFG